MRRANGLEGIIYRCRTKLNSNAQGVKKGYRKEISLALISRNCVSESLNHLHHLVPYGSARQYPVSVLWTDG